jgi:dienelactone hydrolase
MGAARHALHQHAAFLRDNGFVVLNVDSFGPRGLGDGQVCGSLGLLADARRYRTHDAFDALRYLRSLDYVDPDRVFLMGQSNGGSVALIAAAAGGARAFRMPEGGFRAVVAFYPWCGALGTTRPSLEVPLLILAGARDDWTPPEECRRFTSSGAPVRVTIYEEAVHSFDLLAPMHRFMGKLVGHDPAATQDSRRQMIAFFRENGANSPVAPAGSGSGIVSVRQRR